MKTSTFTSFNPSNLQSIRDLVNTSLQTLKQYGVSVNAGHISYQDKSLTIKVEIAIVSKETEGMTPTEIKCRQNLIDYNMYGVKENQIGKKLIYKGQTLKFIGVTPGRKNPYTFLAKNGSTLNGNREFVLANTKIKIK